ncbi:Cobalt transport protein CbiN [Methanimicrococcus hongohii]|uniref:Cobalt transport protein CbiN n=1 Tax=Methanimicrococcus hongohii TaxID=3028295 RepID=A0AA96V0S7_9EURY|nr:energy-coupling factor ABC transporter substrate-binding protein [Methanimicrococcus sp. Hf6]WNY23160.1 Cobalt transport protein CbiN [Methanimicrococcus sp. Hf6]
MKFKVEYLLVIAILIFAAVFVYVTLISDSEFGGADGAAEDLIYELNPEYEPIAEPLWEPPGGETESLLFCLQGAIGALIIGLFFGYYYAMKKCKKQTGSA